MAVRLAKADAENRRLNEQLLTLQEQERSELARDLHDEVSPYLFAIAADAASASRLLNEARTSAAGENVQAIADAVRQMQRQVRQMLSRLRPVGLAEFGLRGAIENLVAFWRRRRPEIAFEIAISTECEDLGDLVGVTICRIIQESLSNAVRHAAPSLIKIGVERDREDVRVVVTDDGRGMRESSRLGYGLVGISERVGAIGGSLSFSNKCGEGLTVMAVLPRRQADDVVSTLAEANAQ